jgi:two-component system chemotaxis response regulator CheY
MSIKILIVDDSPVSRMIAKKCLPKEQVFEIFEAGNGKEGLEQFKKNNPDVILMDLTMPVMDGFEALVEIKKLDAKAKVVVLTADIQQKVVDQVKQSGAFMVLPKPLSAEALKEAIAKATQQLKQ